MPYNFICVNTGCFLSQLTSLDDVFSIWTWLKLLGMANLALIPAIILKQYQQRQKGGRIFFHVSNLPGPIKQGRSVENKKIK